MAHLNKVQIIGYLGKDPEPKFFPSGDLYVNFTVASTETWKDKTSGEEKKKTTWFNCQATKRLAEIIRDYLHKGSMVYIEGKLDNREYEDDGVKKYFTSINVRELQMLDRKGDTHGGGAPEMGGMEGAEIPAEDDIPF